jgi:hypothetical protein
MARPEADWHRSGGTGRSLPCSHILLRSARAFRFPALRRGVIRVVFGRGCFLSSCYPLRSARRTRVRSLLFSAYPCGDYDTRSVIVRACVCVKSVGWSRFVRAFLRGMTGGLVVRKIVWKIAVWKVVWLYKNLYLCGGKISYELPVSSYQLQAITNF